MEKRPINFDARKVQLQAVVKAAEGIKDRKSTERKHRKSISRKEFQL